jgi:hypothetical protein
VIVLPSSPQHVGARVRAAARACGLVPGLPPLLGLRTERRRPRQRCEQCGRVRIGSTRISCAAVHRVRARLRVLPTARDRQLNPPVLARHRQRTRASLRASSFAPITCLRKSFRRVSRRRFDVDRSAARSHGWDPRAQEGSGSRPLRTRRGDEGGAISGARIIPRRRTAVNSAQIIRRRTAASSTVRKSFPCHVAIVPLFPIRKSRAVARPRRRTQLPSTARERFRDHVAIVGSGTRLPRRRSHTPR